MYTRVAFLLIALCGLTLACTEHKDCKTCVQNSKRILWTTRRCQWCPLTNTCHTKGSSKCTSKVLRCLISPLSILNDTVFTLFFILYYIMLENKNVKNSIKYFNTLNMVLKLGTNFFYDAKFINILMTSS